jgi:hypothetical protein
MENPVQLGELLNTVALCLKAGMPVNPLAIHVSEDADEVQLMKDLQQALEKHFEIDVLECQEAVARKNFTPATEYDKLTLIAMSDSKVFDAELDLKVKYFNFLFDRCTQAIDDRALVAFIIKNKKMEQLRNMMPKSVIVRLLHVQVA